MTYWSGLEFIQNYKNIISDTYTLIVGFVAIGIPLSIQIAGQASEKYDNSLLAKRLTSGKIVNPISIIIISVVYICFSIAVKLSSSDFPSSSSMVSQEYLPFLQESMFLTFLLTLMFSGWFYIRLYLRSLTTTEKYISKFLMLDQALHIRVLNFFNHKYGWNLCHLYLKNYNEKRCSKSDLRNVSAGLEVLIEQLKNKSWESDFVEILFEFDKKIKRVYFRSQNKQGKPLTILDVKAIKQYWESLIRIVRVSRQVEDAKMSFHSQRLLASIASEIVHHPQYNLIVVDSYSIQSDSKINWTTDLFEIARWQSHQSSKGIDVILECEWLGSFFGLFSKSDFRYSSEGTIAAFRCCINILSLIAPSHPDKIFKIYKNISENMPSYHKEYFNTWSDDRGKKWLNIFWRRFNDANFQMGEYGKLDDMLNSLSDGRAYEKYGQYPKSKLLDCSDIQNAYKAVKFDELYKKAFLSYSEFIVCQFVAHLAFFNKWNELYECLEWKKPRNSSVSYVGEALLPSNSIHLQDVMLNKYDWIENNNWFHDRHDIKPFVFRAFLFQLVYFYERNGSVALLYTSGNVGKVKNQKSILSLLLEQSKELQGNGVFKMTLVNAVENILKKSLISLDERNERMILTNKLSKSRWGEFKEQVENGWNTQFYRVENELKNKPDFNIPELFNINYTKKIMPKEMVLINEKINRKEFLDGFPHIMNNECYGYHAVNRTLRHIYNELLTMATSYKLSELPEINNSLLFTSEKHLTQLGYNRLSLRSVYWEHSVNLNKRGVSISSDNVLLIDKDEVFITFTKNPTSDSKVPLFVYNIDENKVDVEVFLELYFDITCTSDSAVFIMK